MDLGPLVEWTEWIPKWDDIKKHTLCFQIPNDMDIQQYNHLLLSKECFEMNTLFKEKLMSRK